MHVAVEEVVVVRQQREQQFGPIQQRGKLEIEFETATATTIATAATAANVATLATAATIATLAIRTVKLAVVRIVQLPLEHVTCVIATDSSTSEESAAQWA